MSHSPADASDRSLSETENKVTLRCGPAATRYTGTWRLGHKTELEKCVDNLSRFFRARLRRHHSNSAKCERRLGRYQLARIELITSLVFGLNLFEGLAASSNIPSSRYLLGPVHRRSSHRADARTRAGTTGSTCRVPGRAGPEWRSVHPRAVSLAREQLPQGGCQLTYRFCGGGPMFKQLGI